MSLSLSLGGCVTSATDSPSLMDARAETPAREYLPVEDIPSKRPALTADEVSKLKRELINTRARQAAKARSNADSTKP